MHGMQSPEDYLVWIDGFIQAADERIARKELLPFAHYLPSMRTNIKHYLESYAVVAREGLTNEVFSATTLSSEDVVAQMGSRIHSLESRITAFTRLQEQARAHISVEIHPDLQHGLLPFGEVLVPLVGGCAVYAFHEDDGSTPAKGSYFIGSSYHHDDGRCMRYTRAAHTQTKDEAVALVRRAGVPGTLLIVASPVDYPAEQTMLPTVAAKYLAAVSRIRAPSRGSAVQ